MTKKERKMIANLWFKEWNNERRYRAMGDDERANIHDERTVGINMVMSMLGIEPDEGTEPIRFYNKYGLEK